MTLSALVHFISIEKNAGTTMRHILRMNYAANAFMDTNPLGRMGTDGKPKTVDSLDEDVYQIISEIQSRQKMLGSVAANLPFGIHKYLNRPVAYITFLREPVSRFISYWYFAYQTRHRAPLWSILQSYDFDLRRILQDRIAYQFSNDQIRMITGSSVSEVGETEFQLACDVIEERFFLVGAVEYFDCCLKELACKFNWTNTSCHRLNVGTKTDVSLLPDLTVRYFQEANEWDVRLYEWLVKRYLPRRVS